MSSRDHARKFNFLREIASGGFGSVYLAKVQHTDGFSRIAAVKLLHPKWSENREVAQRMRDEARLLGWLHHRNIVDVIDLTTIGGRVAVVMEYLEAVDLRTVGQALAARREPMSPRAAVEILAFVASALDAAFNRPPYPGAKALRVIHRDLKPSNIMVDENGTVKVLDFGVARADFEHRESNTQELQFGSVDYMPPERLFNEPEDPASDVYSLGGTLYEVLAFQKFGKAKGKSERHAAMVRERLDALLPTLGLGEPQGQALRGLLSRMLAYDHSARPTAAEVTREARALARTLEGEGLIEWAERVIPPLVREARDAPRPHSEMVDATFTEDTGVTTGVEHTDPGYGEASSPRIAPPPAAPVEAPAPAPVTSAAPVPAPVPAPVGAPPRDDAATWIYEGPPPGVAAQRTEVAPVAPPEPPAGPVAADAPARARPVARPSSGRRGPPPPVNLNPPLPLADDPGLLSAPFPRHLDPNKVAAGLTPLTPAQAAAVQNSEPPGDDDDSDARVIELARSSPTLVFPLDPTDRDEDDPGDDDDSEFDATVPAMDRVLIERVRAASPVREPAARPAEARGPGDTAAPDAPAAPDGPAAPAAPSDAAAPGAPGDAGALGGLESGAGRPGAPVITHRVVSAAAVAPPLPAVPESAPARPVPLPTASTGTAPLPAPVPATARVRRPNLSLEPSQPTVVPAPPALPDPEPVARPAGRNWIVIVLGLLGFLLLVGVVGLWVVWTYVIAPWQAQSAVDASPHAEDQAVVSGQPGERPEGAIRFVSAAPDTSRIVATCDGKEASGAGWVDWTGPAPTTCTVRVLLGDRTRLYAEVASPEPATWTCFADAEKSCAR